MGVVNLGLNLRIRIVSVSPNNPEVTEVNFSTKNRFFSIQCLVRSDRVSRYILATECAISTLRPLLYSPQIGELAGTNNSIFDFCAIGSVFLDTVTFLRKSASTGTPIINFCFRDFNFREWYQDLRNSRNLNPTKIMPYTVSSDKYLYGTRFLVNRFHRY